MPSGQQQTIKMFYSGQLEYISYSVDTKYEDFIKIAIERFDIPDDFKDFIQISNESAYFFQKETFEYYIMLFPKPEMIFFIRVDHIGILDSMRLELPHTSMSDSTRLPFTRLSNKRHNRNENEAVPVSRQNCFLGSLPETETGEEPKVKRPRIDVIQSRVPVVKKVPSKRSIRI